jgi:hypothetical protein
MAASGAPVTIDWMRDQSDLVGEPAFVVFHRPSSLRGAGPRGGCDWPLTHLHAVGARESSSFLVNPDAEPQTIAACNA